MKQMLLFACLFLSIVSLKAQTVFVDIDAMGSGDGTSWENAYTNLNDALLAAPAGASVWIATGTYITPDSTSFFVDKELTILGGFAGTEMDAAAADPAANPTVLSGDVAQNDVQGGYDSLSRVDNQPVLFFQDTNAVSAYTITLAGVTVQDGNTEGFVDGSLLPFAGGGLLSFAQCSLSNVTFRANRADFGSAIAVLFESAAGSSFDNVTVADNYAASDETIYLRLTSDISFTNSSFSAAVAPAASGMFFVQDMTGVTIENSTFADISANSRGPALQTSQADSIVFRGCSFNRISGTIGGALAIQTSDGIVDGSGATVGTNLILDDCDFKNITSTSFGGVVFTATTNVTATNTTFDSLTMHTAGGAGGAFQIQRFGDAAAVPLTHTLDSVTITNSTANFGGGFNIVSTAVDQSFISNVTIDNINAASGAAGFWLSGPGTETAIEGPSVIMENMRVSNCVTTGSGGAARISDIAFSISNSTISSNVGQTGAGLYLVFGVDATISGVEFDGNGGSNVDAFRGGGIGCLLDEGSIVNIDSCRFISNTTVQQPGIVSGGGGVYFGNLSDNPYTTNVTNTLFEGNTASGTASGGAIRVDDGLTANVENTRFFFNSGDQGGAIFTFLFEIPDTVDGTPIVTLPAFDFDVNSSIFNNNNASTQGGAVCTQRTGMDFTNTAFTFNSVGEDGGGGGAIIFNGSSPNLDGNNDFDTAAESVLTSEIVNCSFFANRHSQSETGVGNAIAFFQTQNPFDTTEQSINVTLQNNIFFQEDVTEIPIQLEPATVDPLTAFGPVNITSNGGNLFNVGVGAMITLNAMLDIVDLTLDDAEDIFEDPFEDESDFPLLRPVFSDNNPLIGAGVTGGLLPMEDIEGNPRGEEPEIGAYELDQSLTDVQDIEESGLEMRFFPNPAKDVLNITSEDPALQSYRLTVTDLNGRVLRANRFNGSANEVNLRSLPAGTYFLQVNVAGAVYSKQIVKQ